MGTPSSNAFNHLRAVVGALGLLFAALIIVNCGADEPVVHTVVVEKFVEVQDGQGVQSAPGLAGAPAPAGPQVSVQQVEKVVGAENEELIEVEVETAAPSDMVGESVDDYESSGASDGVEIALQNQSRVIVRNAEMTVQSQDPSITVEAIGMLAVSRGGWIVESSSGGSGFHSITIRVPAEILDAVIAQITNSVVKVETVNSTSTDFTEEFIDLGARRITVQETVNALTDLLTSGRYDDLEKLLEVQREITRWQTELEKIDGRLRFIRESAAFSRLIVTVNRAPIQMRVDIDGDVQAEINVQRQFTARFYPPEGYERFEVTWDFGDGTDAKTVDSALRTQGEDGVLSVPAIHTYTSDDFSPYVVSVDAKAYSDDGLAEGSARFWAQVVKIPIRVDVGEDVRVGINVPKPFTARFYPPEGYDRFEITWDFGDGTGTTTVRSAIQTQDSAGYLSAPAIHTYTSDYFSPYVVSVNIKAISDTGVAEGEGKLWAYVSELPAIEPFITAPGFVEEGQEEAFLVTFNHPTTIRNLQYSWDFRDGSEIQTARVEPGVTSVEINHAYHRWRNNPYEVRFEIWGDSDAGEVRETRIVRVGVNQSPTVDSSDFEPGETAMSGLNTLVDVFTIVATAAIWIATTLPIWLIAGAIIFFAVRFIIRRQRNLQRFIYVPRSEGERGSGRQESAS